MKKIILILTVVFSVFVAKSQDILFMQNGEELETKIIEVNSSQVKYKMYNDLEGPIYIVNRADAFKIKYASGSESLLNEHKMVEETEKNRPSVRREGIAVRPEFGGILLTDDRLKNALRGFDVGLNVVYQLNKKFSLGAGVSYYGVKNCGNFLPVYFNLRGYFKNRLSSPYYDIRVGYAISTNDYQKDVETNAAAAYLNSKVNGAYLRFGVGMDIKNFVLGVNVGLCVRKDKLYVDEGDGAGFIKVSDSESNNVFIGLNIGYNIQCSKKK